MEQKKGKKRYVRFVDNERKSLTVFEYNDATKYVCHNQAKCFCYLGPGE